MSLTSHTKDSNVTSSRLDLLKYPINKCSLFTIRTILRRKSPHPNQSPKFSPEDDILFSLFNPLLNYFFLESKERTNSNDSMHLPERGGTRSRMFDRLFNNSAIMRPQRASPKFNHRLELSSPFIS